MEVVKSLTGCLTIISETGKIQKFEIPSSVSGGFFILLLKNRRGGERSVKDLAEKKTFF